MIRRFGRTAALVLALALVAAACGDDDAAGDATTTTAGPTTTRAGQTTTPDTSPWGLPLIDPLDVPSGDIGIAGSSTVFPLSTAVLTRWIDEGGPEYSIDSIGSGGGFERFCVEGASDVSNASRPIKDEEVEACRSIGREPIEIRVGTDALSVVISPGNYFAQELTLEQIATLFSLPEGGTWDMVDPSFPPHPVGLYSPGADSGTFDYFNEEVYDEADPSPILSSGVVEIVGENDNTTVTGVSSDGCTEGDTNSVCAAGYFGYAYYQQNADRLQVVAVDGITPDDDSVNAGTYPLARPLLMYTDAGIIAEKPQVAAFIAFYLDVVNDVIGEVGYFPAPDEALQQAANAVGAAAGFPGF
jgi:phosphate transport system substrate-binding protein